MSDDVERVRALLDIVDVVGKRLPLKKMGKDFKGLCPFHDDKSPSLNVNRNLGIYKCFACGAGGDAFKFVMEFHRLDFKEALVMLAEEVGVELTGKRDAGTKSRRPSWLAAMQSAQNFFQDQFLASPVARQYCRDRGLTDEVLATWGIGYGSEIDGALADKLKKEGYPLAECKDLFLVAEDAGGGYFDRFRGRLTFPIFDEGGRIVAFGGRLLGKGHPNQPKYINSSDTPLYSKRRVLYGMHRAKDSMTKSNRAILVEGYLDVIACHEAGATEAVASLGTSLSEEHARYLARWVKEVVVLYDADAAGEKAAERASELLTAEGVQVRVALMPAGEDPDTLLRSKGAAAVHRAIDGSLNTLAYKLERLKSAMGPDQPAFWEEAVKLLAQSERWTDVAGHIDSLAAMYPFTRDVSAARRAIERDVKQLMVPQNRKRVQPARRTRVTLSEGMSVWEATVLRAVISNEFFRAGWEAISEDDLFFTSAGILVRDVLATQFDESHHSNPLNLPDLVGTPAFDTLVSLDHKSLLPLNAEDLRDAIAELRHRKSDRERQRLAENIHSDDDIAEIARKIRERKSPKAP